jgi:hypothetical protein
LQARFIEKLDGTNKNSRDDSIQLLADVDMANQDSSYECIKLDFSKINRSTTAVLLFLEGGQRNFQFVNTMSLEGMKIASDTHKSFLPTAGAQNQPLFTSNGRIRKDFQGMALCVLYIASWIEKSPQWVLKPMMEGFGDYGKGKDETCSHLVITSVPQLGKFRPRLFGHVRDISAALSSHALPKLKKKFLKNPGGLQLGQFTAVLFNQLYQTHPKVAEETEAAYAVAMIQEMFFQIGSSSIPF